MWLADSVLASAYVQPRDISLLHSFLIQADTRVSLGNINV